VNVGKIFDFLGRSKKEVLNQRKKCPLKYEEQNK
jgi:hypothetical protein